MEDFKSKTIYKQAMSEYYEKRGKYRNPFPPGSNEYNAYERGWTQALKRQRGTFPEAPERKRPMSEKYRNMRDWSSGRDD